MPKHLYLELYRPIQATSFAYFNTCFYCGCIATEMDFCPPPKFASFYIESRQSAEFFQIPACRECFFFLENETKPLLHERQLIAKRKFAYKYRKAMRVFDVWEEEELQDLDYALRTCISAGLRLGKESYDRYTFMGFEFEADGEKHSELYSQQITYSVFGEIYNSYRDALSYASKAFRIQKSKLQELYAENNNNFDRAIREYYEEIERKVFKKNLNIKCSEFAKEHKLNVRFVVRTIEQFLTSDEELTIDMALKKLKKHRESRVIK